MAFEVALETPKFPWQSSTVASPPHSGSLLPPERLLEQGCWSNAFSLQPPQSRRWSPATLPSAPARPPPPPTCFHRLGARDPNSVQRCGHFYPTRESHFRMAGDLRLSGSQLEPGPQSLGNSDTSKHVCVGGRRLNRRHQGMEDSLILRDTPSHPPHAPPRQ